MPYFPKTKILFVHIPKCGGTSINELLYKTSDIELYNGILNNKRIYKTKYPLKKGKKKPNFSQEQHYTAKELYNYNIPYNHSFTVVRNPYTRVISMWKYQNKHPDWFNSNIYKVEKDINIFIENLYNLYKKNKLYTIRHNCPQTYFIYDNEDKLMVEKVYYLEETTHLFGKKLEIYNKIRKDDIPITKKSYEYIKEIYSKDFELLGYSINPEDCKNSPIRKTITYTFCIKTFNRPKCLEACLLSIKKNTDTRQVIVIDDSTHKTRQNLNYTICSTIDLDIKYRYIGSNKGISYGRNMFLPFIYTKYVFYTDDNFIFLQKNNYMKYMYFIEKNLIDVLGFTFNNFDKKIFTKVEINDKKIYTIETKNSNNNILIDKELQIYKKDMVINLFITRKDILKQFPFDNRLKIREHIPWFSVLWKNNKKVAQVNKKICNKLYFNYQKDPYYINYRKNSLSLKIADTIWARYYKHIQ